MKDIKDVKKTALSMDGVFMLLWALVLLAVLLVTLLGQVLTTVLVCVALVAYINKMNVSKDDKK